MFPLLANLMTVFRILLIFVLLPLMSFDEYDWKFILIFQIIFIAAALTDYLDGYIARKYKQQTVFGKFFDPIADKLLVIIALFYLCQFRFLTIPKNFFIEKRFFLPILMVIIIREFLVSGVRMLAAENEVVVEASFLGKAKTLFTFLAIFFLFFGLYLNTEGIPPSIKEIFRHINKIGDVFLLLATFLTIISGIDYFCKNFQLIVKNFSPNELDPKK
ncbi:Phosphatidylglycerophosphate synthase [Candidatus Phytoplasma australiense]|uniref:CDP-diacylglycerol--glycerol-3-phosphate 3-phosphatidyltransferase n=1 Tax=Phytoplasma australiense TaxID=59748 RepID=B1VB27_PHYAS|nr:CDP-diacylglycerol--glycerol-3-phosphate 3-phosphatidyltransferase [Candidatus Phytoplasma australiense]CAM12150.1 Phosphatidylglycerophosphate synthase [Candidatus Phytoplasma australiense]